MTSLAVLNETRSSSMTGSLERVDIDLREEPTRRRWQADGFRAFGVLAVIFVSLSLQSWGQQVSTVEMNRNDAACYMILARNVVQHGVYSLDQVAPFAPHTEWPPGVPLLYALPLAVVGEFPLAAFDVGVMHAWSLALAVGSLWLLWRYLREITSPLTALCVTAITAATKAFLDSANAPTADALAVGAAFFALREVEVFFRNHASPSSRGVTWPTLRVHLALACVPLIKPYLGMVFVAYLWKLAETPLTWRTRLKGVVALGLCCLPFAGFIGYSVVAAQQTGNISAITWLTTDNPTAIQEGVAATDKKSLGEWVGNGLRTLRYFLIYNIADAALPVLSWIHFTEWPGLGRMAVLGVVLGVMACGVFQAVRTRRVAGVAYAAAMLAFFVVFACDSPRYFTVLTPMCGLFFVEGLSVVANGRRSLSGEASAAGRSQPAAASVLPLRKQPITGLFAIAALAAILWGQHRAAHAIDPQPFYQEVYTALRTAAADESIEVIVVPYQLRSFAIVETGKLILSCEEFESADKDSRQDLKAAFVVVAHDPHGRIAPSNQRLETTREVTSGQFVSLRSGAR